MAVLPRVCIHELDIADEDTLVLRDTRPQHDWHTVEGDQAEEAGVLSRGLYGSAGEVRGDRQWFNYLPDEPDFSYDYIKYINGYWDGVTDFTPVAVYNDFDDVRVPFREFVNLVDFQSHLLKTVYGYSVKNNYHTIYIFSYKSINSIYKRFKLKKNWFNLFIV